MTAQCDQDPDAIAQGQAGVPELVPLRLPDLHGGRVVQVLEGDNAKIRAVDREHPSPEW